MATNYSEKIDNMYPGDSVEVMFPKGFMLECKKFSGEVVTFECERLSVYYWDEEDHCCISYYYYEVGGHHWICKEYALTEESRRKVLKYLRENYPSKN